MYKNYKNVEIIKPAGLELKDRLVGIQRVTKVLQIAGLVDYIHKNILNQFEQHPTSQF